MINNRHPFQQHRYGQCKSVSSKGSRSGLVLFGRYFTMKVHMDTGRTLVVLMELVLLFKLGCCGEDRIALIVKNNSHSDTSLYDAAIKLGKDRINNLSRGSVSTTFVELYHEPPISKGYAYLSVEAYFVKQVKGFLVLGKSNI